MEMFQRALIAALLVTIVAGFLGTFLLIRNLALIGDGLAHVSFGGVAVGVVLGSAGPLWYALLFSIIAAILIHEMQTRELLTGDASIAIFLTGMLALGLVVLRIWGGGITTDIEGYLFGNLLSIQWIDIYGLTLFFVLTIILFRMQWRSLVITTIHTELAYVINLPVTLSKYFLFIGTSIALICGVKLLGIILVSALLIIPVLTANQIGSSFKSTLIGTQICGISCSFMGILFAYILDIPSGPSIALLLVCIFLSAYLYSNVKKHTQGVKI